MTISLQFYSDAGLTTPATLISALQASDGSVAAVDRVVYLGSIAASTKFRASSNPGVDQIVVSIYDAAPGSGVEVGHVKIASTNGGLSTAVAGSSLALGTEILSGAENCVPVHVRIDTPPLAISVYTDAGLAVNSLIEEAV